MGKIIFQESTINLTHGRKGKLAVFMFVGSDDPVEKLDWAVSTYVGHDGYNEYVDINMDNPWTRVILSDINDMEQVEFDPSKHKMKP
jgi:hypothetical protein